MSVKSNDVLYSASSFKKKSQLPQNRNKPRSHFFFLKLSVEKEYSKSKNRIKMSNKGLQPQLSKNVKAFI